MTRSNAASMRIAAAAITVLSLGACVSPTSEARKVATLSAAQTSLFQSEMERLARSTQESVDRRVKTAALLRRAIGQLQADVSAFAQGAEDSAAIAGLEKEPGVHLLINRLKTGSDRVNDREIALLTLEADTRKTLSASIAAIQVPSTELAAAATTLGELGKEQGRLDRAKLVFQFFKPIYQDVKKLATESSENAKSVDTKSSAIEQSPALMGVPEK